MSEYTTDINGLGTLHLFDAICTAGLEKHARFYQASSSKLYREVVETPQGETTPFHSRSLHGVAKLYAYWIMANYRDSAVCTSVTSLNKDVDYVKGMWRMFQQPTPVLVTGEAYPVREFVEKAFAMTISIAVFEFECSEGTGTTRLVYGCFPARTVGLARLVMLAMAAPS
ncbi:uncharacterized protein F5147DRAFT_652848 [Suillus discolor]|uniref:GDP-mannose 4,6-dehydratase n=1 Tax=Suillus discolor TaxID=1912936 RepID=A0A9P7F6J4_9AGAM|nr:uncharacterized protein F5147DRAFT_652848 [Suillus discolor]KAG2108495.1 hypothetical protein F5147DRAFT_652848 [Suillus discolor]